MSEATVVVIFGITGDLSARKLLPAFFSLWKAGKLSPQFRIVGFSRRPFTNEEIRGQLESSLKLNKQSSPEERAEFLSLIQYKQGIFDDPSSYKSLAEELLQVDKELGTCSNKLFYLAVPPTLYTPIIENLAQSGLSIPCGGDKGFARVLIEKPFGNDLTTAEKLDELLGKLFDESQVYRIDHYLGKETLQNILTFRFSNTLFEPLWNHKHIEKVEISLFETNTVDGRGEFYDKVGALKDVGQNHLLQMLALVAMQTPKDFSCAEVRQERANVLKELMVVSEGNVKAQYEGYSEEVGVSSTSETETYFKITTNIDNSRWSGVPFILSSGKAVGESKTEIKVYFKDPDPKSFLPKQFPGQEVNTLTFRIQPNEGIEILFWVKVPGFDKKIEPRKLAFNYADSDLSIPDAYERILYDCIVGDQTLFPSTTEILSEWKFIEDAIVELNKLPLQSYKIGTKP